MKNFKQFCEDLDLSLNEITSYTAYGYYSQGYADALVSVYVDKPKITIKPTGLPQHGSL